MRPFSLLATVFAFAILSAPAKATPPSNALRGTINGTPVALYVGPAGFADCFLFEWQVSGGAWESPFSPIGCGNISQASVDAAGGPVPFIASWLPYINPSIAGAFGGAGGISAQLNTAFTTAFKFTGAASPAVAAK